MLQRLRMLTRLPNTAMLAYRLFRDPRVPTFAKGVAVGAIVLIISPLDILDWIPIAGWGGEIGLILMVLRAFINAAPEAVRVEHMAAIGMTEV
ncbi:MAG: hypothetical protein JO247_22605 [Chloroflexi bacterium]|nr:hypothetical protein [Chloroflexota bacterium]